MSGADRDRSAPAALSALADAIERSASPTTLARAAGIALVAFDVDGVMTDGALIQGDDALEHKRFHARDTIGLRLLGRAGLKIAIVSGRASSTLENRARELDVDALHQGVDDKLAAFEALAADCGVPPARCAFVGDDVVDLPPMRRAGLALCPADAHPLVRAEAHHALSRRGGEAAVREAAELLLHARGALADAFAPWLD